MTAMTLTLLGNYQQTGHFGGPLAYTPLQRSAALGGPRQRRPALRLPPPQAPVRRQAAAAGWRPQHPHPLRALMIQGEAMARRFDASGDERFRVDPRIAMLAIDALGFRRGAGALKTLLADANLAQDPLFAQAKLRGIRSLAGHSETTDLINDVNGGPVRIGIATARRQGRVLGFHGRRRVAQDRRPRRRVRDDRRPRPGTQDAGGGAARRQAPCACSSPTTTPASTIR